ncbi:hypothetical protein MNBD_ALPHA09-1190 [hydrothermal vent metagenome]|uniref:NnrU domain-containing protein n=1 Tax=hydrothermal vent metagenome TaxID=652676 RepID=A0A3B0TSY6_9ZZZZ
MAWLLIGILLWSAVHFIPCLAPGFRRSVQERLGENAYKAMFLAGILAAITLMVMGWRATDPWSLYEPPSWGRPVGGILTLAAFLLFAFSQAKTNVKRLLRHPQLTGLVLWAIGHLFVNGDNRSLVLFGGLAFWALLEMVLINRREGAWRKPERVPLTAEILPAGIGLALFVVFLFAHPILFGVSPFPQ